jgi:hypothetical protein
MDRRYEVHWLDSGKHLDGWRDKDSIIRERPEIVCTVGYKVHEDEENLYMALTSDRKSSQYFGVQVIDKNSIKRISPLRAR